MSDFILTFKPIAGDSRPTTMRLRRLLKFALRSCRLRCVQIEPAKDSESEAHKSETRSHEQIEKTE